MTAVTATSVATSWTAVTGATSYETSMNSGTTASTVWLTTGSATPSKTFTALTQGPWTFAVRAKINATPGPSSVAITQNICAPGTYGTLNSNVCTTSGIGKYVPLAGTIGSAAQTACTNKPTNAASVTYAGTGGALNQCPYSTVTCSTGFAWNNNTSFAGALCTAVVAGTTPELLVAFTGDTGASSGMAATLTLVKNEGAAIVMINGDFSYVIGDTASWKNGILAKLDPNQIAIMGSLGNHDVKNGDDSTYISIFNSFRNATNKLSTNCTGSVNANGSPNTAGTVISQGHDIIAVDEVCNYGNVSLISSANGQTLTAATGNPLDKPYLEGRLKDKLNSIPPTQWKVVGYHYTLPTMNPGIKTGLENSYNFFNYIREAGAIGIQAHTHTVMASCPISSVFSAATPTCDPTFSMSDLANRFTKPSNSSASPVGTGTGPGTGMFLDSSSGGNELRDIVPGRCSYTDYSLHDCDHLIDLITDSGYRRADGVLAATLGINQSQFTSATTGVMFIRFNKGGNPKLAQVYYKTTAGNKIFEFNITRP